MVYYLTLAQISPFPFTVYSSAPLDFCHVWKNVLKDCCRAFVYCSFFFSLDHRHGIFFYQVFTCLFSFHLSELGLFSFPQIGLFWHPSQSPPTLPPPPKKTPKNRVKFPSSILSQDSVLFLLSRSLEQTAAISPGWSSGSNCLSVRLGFSKKEGPSGTRQVI